jgi:hypothetical protein
MNNPLTLGGIVAGSLEGRRSGIAGGQANAQPACTVYQTTPVLTSDPKSLVVHLVVQFAGNHPGRRAQPRCYALEWLMGDLRRLLPWIS